MSTKNGKEYTFDRYTSRPLYGICQEAARDLPILGEVDVLVVGGSPSGCAAAICAARSFSGDASVHLVERYGFLGGQSVYGLVTQWEKRAFINNLGAVATRGIAREMVDRIVAKGGSDGLWTTPPGCEEMRDGEEWLDIDAIQLSLIEMCEQAGVELLLHTQAVDVVVENGEGGRPRMTGVIFENKSGRFCIRAQVVVDATADLDLVWRAAGEEGCAMRPPEERMSAGAYVWYGGVDDASFIDYVLSTPGQDGFPDPVQHPTKVRRHLAEGKLIKLWGMSDILDQARELGLLQPIEEAQAAIKPAIAARAVDRLSLKSVGHGRWCYAFSFPGLNLLDAWQVTRYEVLRIKLASWMLPVMRLIPGWENCYIDRANLHVGGRESRYLRAVTMLTSEDLYRQDADASTPPDAVGRSGAHDPGKNRLWVAYPILYGMIVPQALDGVLCCTRAVGAEPHVALNAHRGIVPTIVVGQAAGTAAALAVEAEVAPRDVDLAQLQETLRGDDVVLDVERIEFDFEIPQDKVKRDTP